MTYKIFIDGGEGTTGLRLSNRLSSRYDIELLTIDSDLRKDIAARMEVISKADIVFLCLPDTGSKEIVGAIEADLEKNKEESAFKNLKIIDASTAYRVNDAWTYGLPELYKTPGKKYEATPVETSKRVCVPGCHATGFIVSINPLIEAGLIDANQIYSAHSLSGYSGAGKSAIALYESCDAGKLLSAPRQYALTQTHKHIPEMMKYSGVSAQPVFAPIICNFYSGMLVSVSISNTENQGLTVEKVHDTLAEKYDGCQFIRVRELGYNPEDGFLSAIALSDRDDLEMIVTGGAGCIEIITRYDNLGKGASGAAIQCMNRMLGMPEDEGLILGE